MRWMRVPLAAVAACASVFAAGQAGAVTKLVWEITPDDPTLSVFQQTWTLDNGHGVTTPDPPTTLYGFIGDAAASASPVTAALLAQTHVTTYNLASFDFTRGIDDTDDTNDSIGFFLNVGGTAKYDFTATQYTQSNYSVQIFASSFGLTLPSGEPTIDDLIAYAKDPSIFFFWDEHVDASNLKLKNDDYLGDVFNTDYSGVARLISVDDGSSSAAPEPAAWALMILGFGAAGAAMRGRSRLAA